MRGVCSETRRCNQSQQSIPDGPPVLSHKPPKHSILCPILTSTCVLSPDCKLPTFIWFYSASLVPHFALPSALVTFSVQYTSEKNAQKEDHVSGCSHSARIQYQTLGQPLGQRKQNLWLWDLERNAQKYETWLWKLLANPGISQKGQQCRKNIKGFRVSYSRTKESNSKSGATTKVHPM